MLPSISTSAVTVFGPAVQVTLPTTSPSRRWSGVVVSIVTVIGVSDHVKIDAPSPSTICAVEPQGVE